MTKKVAIIGAGLAGLSAGIYLQKSGVTTEIFELAPWAGGVCTAWVRQGYRFDGCIHWMVGTKPGTSIHKLYLEVGALTPDTQIYNSEAVEFEIDGKAVKVPLRLPEFSAFLHALAPEDSRAIDSLCKEIKAFSSADMPLGGPTNLTEMIRMLTRSRGFLSIGGKYLNLTMGDYLKRFQNPDLKAVLLHLMPAHFSTMALIMMLGTRMGDNAGYPLGGAEEVIKRIEGNYRASGGTIHFQNRVEKIIVENGQSVGLVANGQTYAADAVIVASDAYDALHNLLGEQYKHPQLDNLLNTALLFEPLVLVSFGLDRSFNLPFARDYEIPEGIATSPDTKVYGFGLRAFDFDPSAAPKSGSSVMVMMGAPLAYWQELRKKNMADYKKRKQVLADEVAAALDRRMPGFKAAIKVTDVATPATYVHVANLYKASFEGFLPTPALLKTSIRTTIPGIKNLVLSGQWTTPGGGICTAVNSGKMAARQITKTLSK